MDKTTRYMSYSAKAHAHRGGRRFRFSNSLPSVTPRLSWSSSIWGPNLGCLGISKCCIFLQHLPLVMWLCEWFYTYWYSNLVWNECHYCFGGMYKLSRVGERKYAMESMPLYEHCLPSWTYLKWAVHKFNETVVCEWATPTREQKSSHLLHYCMISMHSIKFDTSPSQSHHLYGYPHVHVAKMYLS